MKLYKELDINLGKKELITFVGAGGKTSSMFCLAKELKELGKKVLVTTTTAIYFPDNGDYDLAIITKEKDYNVLFSLKNGNITVIGRELTNEGKLRGFANIDIDQLYMNSNFDYIIVEGDGSRKKPIKAPAEYEPVIPSLTDCTIGVIGMDSIGKQINPTNVHRIKEFCNIVNEVEENIIDEKIITKLVVHKLGIFKNTPKNSRKYLLLNKVEEETKKSAKKIGEILINENINLDGIIVVSLIKNSLHFNWRGRN